jgi:hypothetical protein
VLPLSTFAESAVSFYLRNQATEIVFDNHAGGFYFLNYAPIRRRRI